MGDPDQTLPNNTGSKLEDHSFIAKAVKKIDECHTRVDARNKFYQSEAVEIVTPEGPDRLDHIYEIRDPNNESVGFAQPGSRVTIKLNQAASQNDLIRKVVS
jgi:hypothetical protein